jgi:hypothetical protein
VVRGAPRHLDRARFPGRAPDGGRPTMMPEEHR